eukprot:CAMPEP_0113875664 /NCGR_PEP_ID=MMETSP0780_2-20120614/5065_1 /TAXON_ID=652834 /ORGANISM="Palpitomonas bilix" /LENGTH=295 /DNA_ID=CAMNT_0000861673 /DNA_START=21 /DNA_END=908 /DNA_ORIENTATION=- /assembly_acc=CAM_ASM_000599
MASRVVFVAALLLALVASAQAGGCATADITNFRACGPFLVEHALSEGTTDVPHLDYMKFSSGDAQAEFANLDEQVYNEYCSANVRMNITAFEGDTRVDVRDFSEDCQRQWIKYRCAQIFTPCIDPTCDKASCAHHNPCGSMRDDVEEACNYPYSNYQLRNCSCEDDHPVDGSGGIPGCLYCPPGGCDTVPLPDCTYYNDQHNNGGNNGGYNGEGEGNNGGNNNGMCVYDEECGENDCCCDDDPNQPITCREKSTCGQCGGMGGSDSKPDVPLAILSAITAIVAIFLFIVAITRGF